MYFTAAAIRDSKDNVIGAVETLADITERKRAQEELQQYSLRLEELVAERTEKLRQSEERYRSIVQNIPAMVWTANAKGDTIFVTSNVKQLYGYTSEEIYTGGHAVWSKHIHGDDRVKVNKAYNALFADGRVFDVEYRFQRPDGKLFWFHDRANMVYEKDGVRYVDGVTTDVTERKQIEERLRLSERLAAIGEATAMIGHDLRNPLQGITATLYLLRKHYEDTPENQKKLAAEYGLLDLLSMAEESVDYMDKIVSDLQSYAAPLQPDPASISLDQFLKEILATIHVPASVKVSVNVEEGCRALTVDPALMKRVFTNLAINAVQAMPHGGELEITAQRNRKDTLISFQDTGDGIPEENLPRLFTPFYTTKARGQGLGLAVCKRLVEAHRGSIAVNSTIGKGTTFTVKIPSSRNERN